MSSKILYDTRTNEIKRCQLKPHGSASLPSLASLCKSARISENDKEFMKTIVINEDYLTSKAKEELRIVDGEAIEKPKCVLTIDKSDFDIDKNLILTLEVEIKNTLENEIFDEVTLLFEDTEFVLDLSENHGEQQIEISEPDTYIISCNDNRFISRPVKIEV